MKLVIEATINHDLSEAEEAAFAKRVVEALRASLDGNTIIEEALGPNARIGRRHITIEQDSPVIYGVRE